MESRKPTRKDVAKLAEVSEATVSNVFNNKNKRVSEETTKRVLEAARKLDYRPDLIARSLKTGKTNVIGLTIPIISSPMLSVLANHVHESLFKCGYMVNVINTHEDKALEDMAINLLHSQSVDGLIACPVSRKVPEVIRKFSRRGVPVVFLDRYATNFEADTISIDNIKWGEMGTDHLIGEGCQRSYCISFSRQASSAIDRITGFKRSLQKHNLPFDEHQIIFAEDPMGNLVEELFANHINAHGLPDGILCTSQEIGMGVLKAFRQMEIDFPSQRLVVFDAEWGQLLDPPIPVVKQNAKEMAETAVDILMRRLDGDDSPVQTIFTDAQLLVS